MSCRTTGSMPTVGSSLQKKKSHSTFRAKSGQKTEEIKLTVRLILGNGSMHRSRKSAFVGPYSNWRFWCFHTLPASIFATTLQSADGESLDQFDKFYQRTVIVPRPSCICTSTYSVACILDF